MGLFREIARVLGAADVFRVRYTVTDGGGGYFENVKRIVRFSKEEVVLRGRQGGLRVEGRELSLGKYFAGDLVVYGEIVRVERL